MRKLTKGKLQDTAQTQHYSLLFEVAVHKVLQGVPFMEKGAGKGKFVESFQRDFGLIVASQEEDLYENYFEVPCFGSSVDGDNGLDNDLA